MALLRRIRTFCVASSYLQQGYVRFLVTQAENQPLKDQFYKKLRMKWRKNKELIKLKRLQQGRQHLSDDLKIAENLQKRIQRAHMRIERKTKQLEKYEFPESNPTHDPEILTPDFIAMLRKRARRYDDYLAVGKRGIFEGTIRDIHSHWINHETIRVDCHMFPLDRVKAMAEECAKLSGGTAIEIVRGDKSFILYRGRNYQGPKPLVIENMLDKRKALEKRLLVQSLNQQYLNIRNYTERLELRLKKAEYTELQRKAIIAEEERKEQDRCTPASTSSMPQSEKPEDAAELEVTAVYDSSSDQ